MNGAKLRARLKAGESVTMFNPHHVAPGLAVRLVELGADSIFVDCEHGTWGFEDVRITAQVVRGVGGAAIVRPHSHERPILIRYLNAGADGLMVPMVGTADQAQAVVDAVRYALPGDHDKRLVVAMIETREAIDNLDGMLKVDGIDVFFIGPGTCRRTWGIRRRRRSAKSARRTSSSGSPTRSARSATRERSPGRWSPPTRCRAGWKRACSTSMFTRIHSCALA